MSWLKPSYADSVPLMTGRIMRLSGTAVEAVFADQGMCAMKLCALC